MALFSTALGLSSAASAAEDFRESVPAEPGGELRVRLDRGSVEVEAHARDEVRVDANLGRGFELELRGGGRRVEVIGRGSGGWLSLFGDSRVRVRVRVPEEFDVDVHTNGGDIDVERLQGSIRARTSGGEIRVEGAEGDVELETSGGSVRAEDVEGDLEVKTSGGDIDALDIEGRVQARTSGGSIELRDVEGPVDARTSGGSLRARFQDTPAGVLETSGGDVDVVFPSDAGVDLDARTSGGRVQVDGRLETEPSVGANESRVETRINGGGPRLELRTSGGSIRLRAD